MMVFLGKGLLTDVSDQEDESIDEGDDIQKNESPVFENIAVQEWMFGSKGFPKRQCQDKNHATNDRRNDTVGRMPAIGCNTAVGEAYQQRDYPSDQTQYSNVVEVFRDLLFRKAQGFDSRGGLVAEKDCDAAYTEEDGVDIERPSPAARRRIHQSASVERSKELAERAKRVLDGTPEGATEGRHDFADSSG